MNADEISELKLELLQWEAVLADGQTDMAQRICAQLKVKRLRKKLKLYVMTGQLPSPLSDYHASLTQDMIGE